MKKLMKLKEYLTLEQAAVYLTAILNEPVTVADVLQLALDQYLTLSVHFVNGTMARPGKVVHYTYEQIQKFDATGDYPDDLNSTDDISAFLEVREAGYPCSDIPKKLSSVQLDQDRWMTFENDEIVKIDGIWDLPMIGDESFNVKFKYQKVTGGPVVTLHDFHDTFVINNEDRACKLQVLPKMNMKADSYKPVPEDYFPAGGLPIDSVLVVRVAAIKALEDNWLIHLE